MPDNVTHPSLKETLQKSFAKTNSAGEPASPESTEEALPQPSSDSASAPVTTKEVAEEDIPALLQDVDLSKLPSEEARQEFLRIRKQYDKGFHRKVQEASDAIKFLEGLQQDPGLWQMIQDYKSGKRPTLSTNGGGNGQSQPELSAPSSASITTQQAVDRLEGYIKKLPEAAQADVREFAQSILESSNLTSRQMQEKLSVLEKELSGLKAYAGTFQAEQFEAGIDKLEETYPAAFIEKYRATLKTWARQYPTLDLEDILYRSVPGKEIRDALRPTRSSASREQKKVSTKPAPTISSPTNSKNLSEEVYSGEGPSRHVDWRKWLKMKRSQLDVK